MKKYILYLLISIIIVTCQTNKSYINTKYIKINTTLYFNIYINKYDEYLSNNYYNGEHKEVIINKINRVLNSNLKEKGELITNISMQLGVDPYLSTAVILLESGCKWNCSYLSRVCNNYGGNKGSPGCNGGSYKRFNSQEEGIRYMISNLRKYYDRGLTTPELIGPKYASSKTWAKKINRYMNELMK